MPPIKVPVRLVVLDSAALFATMEFAKSVGALDRFTAALQRTCRSHVSEGWEYRVEVYPDRDVPHSFGWAEHYKRPAGDWVRGIFGGLIYRGHGQPGDGSPPAFVVDVAPPDKEIEHDWTIHT